MNTKYNIKKIVEEDILMTELYPKKSENSEFIKWKYDLLRFKGKYNFNCYEEAISDIKDNDFLSSEERTEILLSLDSWERPLNIIEFARDLGFIVGLSMTLQEDLGHNGILICDEVLISRYNSKRVILIDKSLSVNDKKIVLSSLLTYYIEDLSNKIESHYSCSFDFNEKHEEVILKKKQ